MRKVLLFVALLIVVVIGGAVWLALFADYSDGYRVGQVIKLSRKGYVFKTWEGTLDFGYLQTDPQQGVATRIWDFSLARGDDQVRREIDAAIARNDKVKLHYREKYLRLFWRGETPYFVYKVEPAGSTGEAGVQPARPAPR